MNNVEWRTKIDVLLDGVMSPSKKKITVTLKDYIADNYGSKRDFAQAWGIKEEMVYRWSKNDFDGLQVVDSQIVKVLAIRCGS